jgi:hypothetical protein
VGIGVTTPFFTPTGTPILQHGNDPPIKRAYDIISYMKVSVRFSSELHYLFNDSGTCESPLHTQ